MHSTVPSKSYPDVMKLGPRSPLPRNMILCSKIDNNIDGGSFTMIN